MKNLIKKWWAIILKHKVLSVIVSCVLAVSILLTSFSLIFQNTPLFQWGKNNISSHYVTRGEWSKLFAEKFGFKEFEENEPYFSDLTVENDIFPYVQTLAEYEIIEISDKFEADSLISGNQMLFEIGKAFGENYVARRTQKEELKEQDYLDFLFNLDPQLRDYANSKKVKSSKVDQLLDKAHNLFLNREYNNFVDFDLADGVLDLSQNTYKIINGKYVIESESPIKKGDIIILGANQDDPDGQTIKIETVSSNSKQYTVTGTVPELDEVYDEFQLEINQIATVTEFTPAEGVSITEIDEESGFMRVVWDGTTVSGETTLLNTTSQMPFATPLVSGSMNNDISGTLFDLKGKWSSDGSKPLVASPKFFEILEQNPLYKNDLDLAVDKNGNLVSKYESGYEVGVGLKVSDLVLNGSATYKSGVFGTNKRLSFDLNTGITVTPSVSLAGNSNVRLKLGTFNVPINIILSVKVDVYMLIDINGEITVTTQIVSLANVNKSLNSSKINASAKIDSYTEVEANCELKVLLGPDPTITLAGIQIVDAYVLVGVGADMNYTTAQPTQIEVNVYLPLVQAGVGYNPNTLLSKLGVAAGVNIMDKEGALLKCPYDKTFTFEMCQEISKPVIEGVHHKFENGTLTIYGTGKMVDNLVDGEENTPYGEYAATLTKVVIEDGITYIGDASFAYLPNLTTVEMANSVSSAGRFVFQNCTNLKDVKLSESLTGLNPNDEDECADMFAGCTSLEKITLPDSFTVVPWSMFQGCTSLKTVELSKNITTIGYLSFAFSGIEKITLPSKTTKIEESAFYQCQLLQEVIVQGSLTAIERDAFEGCENLATPPKAN